MKKEFVRSTLAIGHLDAATKELKSYTPPSKYGGLIRLLADICDTAIAGTDCYATFGLSRDKSALLLTVTYNHSKLYAGGATLEELSTAAGELI